MDSSYSSFFKNNSASMINHWSEKTFPEFPPALQSTTPLDTPPAWHSPSHFQSPPDLESTTPFDTPADWHGSAHFPSPPALNKINDDKFSSQYIAQESPPALEPLNDNNSLENFENNSSPALFIEESITITSFDDSSSLNSFPNIPIAFKSSALSSAFNYTLDSYSPHIKIEYPKLFQPSSPAFSLDSKFKFLWSIKLEDTSSALDEIDSPLFNIPPPASSHEQNVDEVKELDSSLSTIQISHVTPPSPQEFHSKTLQKRKPNYKNRKYPLRPQRRVCYK
ncbi:hypothetical protein O181_043496 [Austropuccinia psidii MF-1]|uniref:Uncharacterized protein n=1 Tax=Austropuccinia psidii MF-1 TaxID=1389203 RepID=A0A9Q3DNL9_9BASI|nr:hypothetical protein [Austropuccinia psidii MF-1]